MSTTNPLICGYCGLPAVDTQSGTIHGEGTPDVPAATTPGDFATPGHRPGAPINPADIVSEHDDGDECAKYDADHYVLVNGAQVRITNLREGAEFIDYDGRLWVAARVVQVGDDDVHVDIKPADDEDCE